jgi:hypothetical protein
VSSPTNSIPQAAFTQCLRELPNYVVLRNEEDLFGNLQRGGDIDILVEDLELAERTLIRHFGSPVRVIKLHYVRGYSWDWGTVDLLPTIEWRGACYLRTKTVLGSRQLSARGRPVPRIAHEALISWLTSLLFGGFFKERYAAEIRKAVEIDGDAFRQTLIDVAGKRLGIRLWQAALEGHPEISAQWTRSLRLAVWSRACFRSPVRTVQRYVGYAIGELRLRFKPPGPWIAILGADDNSKASLASEIARRFAAWPYGNVKALQWRPRLMARADSCEAVAVPYGRTRNVGIGSNVRLLVLAADWLVGYWARLVHLRAKGYIPAFDCTYFDVVDHERYQYGAGPPLARGLWRLLPKPDLVFLLDSEPDVRKQEVPPSELARQRHAQRAWVRQLPAGHVLNGSLPLSVVADEVQRVIRAWMLERSVASLGGMQVPVMTVPTTSSEGSSGAPPTSLGRGDGARR